MRVVFDVSSCAKTRRKGIANYGAELVGAIARVAPEHQLVLALRSHRWTKRHLVDDILPGRHPRLLVDGLHRLTLGSPIDVLHSIGVRLPGPGRFGKVVTVHDLNVYEFPELSTPQWRAKRRHRIEQTVARATLVLACSEQGAQAMVEHLQLPRDRIRVVPEGVDVERFRRPPPDVMQRVLTAHGLGQRPYVLLIGTPDGRKNHGGLLDAFAHAGLDDAWQLVLGGPRGPQAEALRARARELGLGDDRLVPLDWIEDDELPAIISGSTIYACASLHEGFGRPVLEAQACGVPVVSSNRAALPETVGDCGVLFDPTDRDDFAGALRRLADDDALRADLAARGPVRVAREYGFDQVARQTLAVLTEAAVLGA